MSNQGFSQGFGDVRARARQGQIGDWAKVSHLNTFLTGINQAPQSKQVTTTTVTDPGDDTDITITLNGVDVTFNTGTGLDADGIGAGLAAAINAEPLVRASVIATFDTASDVLTLTGKLPGDTFTVAEASGALSTPSTSAAATAEDIPFGRAILFTGTSPGEVEDLVALAKAPRLAAQVLTATVVTGDATTRSARVYEVRGPERILLAEAAFTGNATQATEATNIANALNAALAANTVVVTTSTADVILTAEVAGLEFELEIEGTAGNITQANTTGPSEATSLHRALAGISLFSPNDEAAAIGGAEGRYAANRGVRYGVRGEIWVSNSQSPSQSDTVYVELADGADSGKLFNTDSSTRLALARSVAQWRRTARTATDNLVVVHIDTGRAP